MENKIEEIQKLSNEDLLTLHSAIMDHLKYLDEKIISEEEKNETDGGEENG